MRKLPVRKLPARKLLWAAVAGALFLPLQGFTLGLGEIEVNSGLNQRLSADIELLSASIEDTENIIIKLGSRKDFARAGLDRPYLLNDLRFKSEIINGVPHIKVSSGSPIREPFLNFLVEIDWPNGHLLREYTVLLDPPVFMTQSANTPSASANQTAEAGSGFRPGAGGAANVVPVVVPGGNAAFRPQATTQAAPRQNQNRYAAVPVVTTGINQPASRYKVKSGDTAWSLADSMRPDQSISVEQMMIAMLRSNPESFINENINGLKRGYILRTPDYEQITSISQADARALVSEQAALWRQLQKTQSAGQPVSAMPADGSVAYDGDFDPAMDGDDASHLAIVSAGSGSSTGSAKDPTLMSAEELRAELALARERVETERVEKEELQMRVDTLESNVNVMKGLLSIEDADLAGAQALNLPADDGEMVADDSGLTEEEIAARQELLEALEGETADGDATGEEMAGDMVADDTSADIADGEEAVFIDEDQTADDAADMSQDLPVEPQAAAPASSPVVDSPEPDPLTRLLSDPILLAAAGGGLLLVIALIALLIKRRKAAAEDDSSDAAIESASASDGIDDLESLADDVAAESEDDLDDVADELVDMPVDEAEGESFDSDSTMVLNSPDDTIMTEAADVAEEVEEEPRDDVIAEADVYLAYGIYQQAEELLTQAIADNPDRDDYRVKLAETHYASKNVEGFVKVAGEIRQNAGSDDVPAWKKVLGMGQDLCPDEAMFKGSMIGGVDVGSLAPKAPEMDFDLGINEAEQATPDLDLSLDDELQLPEMDDSASDMEETAIIDTDATQIIDASDSVEDSASEDAGEEIEFDINDTGAVEESSDAEDEFSLDIDAAELDIGLDETDESEAASSTDEEVSIEIDDIDIGLDDADSTAEEESTDAVQAVEDVDIDFGFDDTDEDQTGDADAGSDETEDDIAIDLSDEAESLDMDFNELESDDAVEEDVEDSSDAAMDFDIGEVEVESEAGSDSSGDDAAVAVEAVADSMEDEFDLSSLDDVDEISTKLDLARAYLDMGDHEGTRGILEEVIAEGTEEQQKEATELMDQLN